MRRVVAMGAVACASDQELTPTESAWLQPVDHVTWPSTVEPGPPPTAATCDPAARPYGGGTGAVDDPWLVCDAAHWLGLSDRPNDAFALEADVDLRGVDVPSVAWFAGSLDGRGRSLIGLYQDRADAPAGLFGAIDGGTVRDVVLVDADVTGHRDTALVASSVQGGGTVERVRAFDARVHGVDGRVGGLVGSVMPDGRVADLWFEGEVTSDGSTGFIGGLFVDCQGLCERVGIEGRVDGGAAWKVGGIANYVSGTLRECVSHAAVSGGTRVAGVVAILAGGVVEDCYADGPVDGLHWVGGLVAETYGAPSHVARAYASGPLTAQVAYGGVSTGGALAWMPVPSAASGVVYDVDRTGAAWSAIGDGVSTDRLRDPDDPAFDAWGAAWLLEAGADPRLAFEPVTAR